MRQRLTSCQRDDAGSSLRTCPLFQHLDEPTLSKVLDTTSMIQLTHDENLFEQGSRAQHIFLLESGYLKLARSSHVGNEKIVEFISPGESFAEAVMFSEISVYPVTATALVRSQVWCIESESYATLLRESTDACFAVMAEFSRRLHAQLSEIDNLSLHSATVRLITYLLQNSVISDGNTRIVELKHTKTVLASRLSIKPETLSRTFAKLSKADLISIEDRRIRLIDLNGLEYLQNSQ